MAGGGLAEPLLHAGQAGQDPGARRSRAAARAPGRVAPRPRASVHPPSSRGVHHHPGDAERPPRGGQPRGERGPPADREGDRGAPSASVGSGLADSLSAHRARLVLAFFAIYILWGSTFLAIRVAVETVPPLFAAGVRFAIAGTILYLWARPPGPASESALQLRKLRSP